MQLLIISRQIDHTGYCLVPYFFIEVICSPAAKMQMDALLIVRFFAAQTSGDQQVCI